MQQPYGGDPWGRTGDGGDGEGISFYITKGLFGRLWRAFMNYRISEMKSHLSEEDLEWPFIFIKEKLIKGM